MTPEKIIQNKIMTYFKNLDKQLLPCYVERRQAGGFSYKMGIADLYAVFDGKHIEIEIKDEHGQLRPMQIKWKEQCERRNILHVVVRDVNDIRNFMKEHFPDYKKYF